MISSHIHTYRPVAVDSRINIISSLGSVRDRLNDMAHGETFRRRNPGRGQVVFSTASFASARTPRRCKVMSTQRETDSERPEEEVSLLSHEDRLGKTTLNEAEQYDENHPLTSENIDDGREQRLPRSRRK